MCAHVKAKVAIRRLKMHKKTEKTEIQNSVVDDAEDSGSDCLSSIPRIMKLLRQYEDDSKEYKQYFSANNLDVTVSQVGVLRTLARDGCMAISKLAETTGMHITTAEGYSKRLSKKNLITVRKDSKDHRRRLLEITPQGLETIKDIPLGHKSMMIHNLRTKGTKEDIAAIEKGLKLLLENMTMKP